MAGIVCSIIRFLYENFIIFITAMCL
jgi:hypothetical protein